MTKKQTIRELRDVMTGVSVHTIAIVEKCKRGWNIETSIVDMNANCEASNQRRFEHCCNGLTLNETEKYLDEAFN